MAFIKCQYTDDYLLTFLLPTSGLSLLICLVLFPGSFLCKLPAVSHVFFLWDIPACFLPYSISFSSSYLPLFFRIISSMLYLGKRVYASFIDLLALLYPFQLHFIGSDPGIPIHPVKCPSVHSNLPVALPDSLLSVLLFRLFGRVLDRTGVWSVFVFSIVVTTSPSSLNLQW